jgi:hypothetical protein
VSCPSDSQNLNIDASVRLDFLFVIFTKFGDLIPFDLSVRNVDVFFQNIDVAEQILPHVVVVRLRVIVADWVVLVKIESDYIFEGEAFLFVEPYQFSVKQQRSAAGGQAEYKGLPFFVFLLDGILNDPGNLHRGLDCCFEEAGLDFLD